MLIFKTCIHLLHCMYTMDGMCHVLFKNILYMLPIYCMDVGYTTMCAMDLPCAMSLNYNTVRFQSTLWMS